MAVRVVPCRLLKVSSAAAAVLALLASAARAEATDGSVARSISDIEAQVDGDVPLVLDAVRVMKLTFRLSPEIRRSYQRMLAEEARYDFFIVSRKAFSYGANLDFDYDRTHDDADRALEKTLSPRLFVRKEFYDTASTSVQIGYDLSDYSHGYGSNAFVSGRLSVPLFASREALERSNEKIYQQNQVNDARLNYVQRIRNQISESLEDLCWAQLNKETVENTLAYKADLEELLALASSIESRDTSADAAKISATLATVAARCDSQANTWAISAEYLLGAIGLPFDTPVALDDADFDPFDGETQEQLEAVAIESDEEIRTLLNSIANAQAELDLARKGKWDTTLYLDASRDFAGNGDVEGDASYTFGTGIEVTRIDNRISRSLERIALANIRDYRDGVISRRRTIHANIVDAYKNFTGNMAEIRAREANLPKYRQDYLAGVALYRDGSITVDDLLARCSTVSDEQEGISDARHDARESMAALLTSTGRYERFIDMDARAGEAALPENESHARRQAAPQTALRDITAPSRPTQ